MVLGLGQAIVYIAVGLLVGVSSPPAPAGIVVLLVFSTLVVLGFGALGLVPRPAHRIGEAVQGMFPRFFVFLFISSMNMPRDLMAVELVPRRSRR